MSRSICLHIIQSFSASKLNSDEDGSPKSFEFGGFRRARTSSSCWKRPLRLTCEATLPDYFGGVRTRRFVEELTKELTTRGLADAAKAAEEVGALIGAKPEGSKDTEKGAPAKKPGDEKKNHLVFYTHEEIKRLADGIATLGAGKVNKKKMAELIEGVQDYASVGVFGRMVAEDKGLSAESAIRLNHPFSVHRVDDNEIDYFTAVDDLDPNGGAGHVSDREFTSAVYYRYVELNLDLFAKHLGHLSLDERKKIFGVIVEAILTVKPVACQKVMASTPAPSYVLAVVQDGQGTTLENAFFAPVDLRRDDGTGTLKAYFAECKKNWGRMFGVKAEYEIPGTDPDEVIKELTAHVK